VRGGGLRGERLSEACKTRARVVFVVNQLHPDQIHIYMCVNQGG
jgi:hypothetical protein